MRWDRYIWDEKRGVGFDGCKGREVFCMLHMSNGSNMTILTICFHQLALMFMDGYQARATYLSICAAFQIRRSVLMSRLCLGYGYPALFFPVPKFLLTFHFFAPPVPVPAAAAPLLRTISTHG